MGEDKLDNIALLKHFLSEAEKLVAVTLAIHRNNLSMMCCPGLTLLAKETGYTRRTIQAAIKGLVQKKEIVKLRITSGKVYLKSQYYFMHDIEEAVSMHKNEESIFCNHHKAEVDNFEFCLARKWFQG